MGCPFVSDLVLSSFGYRRLRGHGGRPPLRRRTPAIAARARAAGVRWRTARGPSAPRRRTSLGMDASREVVVVTGASAGIGQAIARRFGRDRARVALVARNRAGLEGASREIEAIGGEALV